MRGLWPCIYTGTYVEFGAGPSMHLCEGGVIHHAQRLHRLPPPGKVVIYNNRPRSFCVLVVAAAESRWDLSKLGGGDKGHQKLEEQPHPPRY